MAVIVVARFAISEICGDEDGTSLLNGKLNSSKMTCLEV